MGWNGEERRGREGVLYGGGVSMRRELTYELMTRQVDQSLVKLPGSLQLVITGEEMVIPDAVPAFSHVPAVPDVIESIGIAMRNSSSPSFPLNSSNAGGMSNIDSIVDFDCCFVSFSFAFNRARSAMHMFNITVWRWLNSRVSSSKVERIPAIASNVEMVS